jgi:hypothetical protein
VGELVGISIMFAGFRFTGAARKAAPAAPSGRLAQGVPTA